MGRRAPHSRRRSRWGAGPRVAAVRLGKLLPPLVLLLVGCGEKVTLRLGPYAPAIVYDLRWRAVARFEMGGSDQRARVHFGARLVLEAAPGGGFTARLRGVTAQVEAARATGLAADPGALQKLTLSSTAGGGVSGAGAPPQALAALLAPRSPVMALSFPPVPAEPVKRGARWARAVPVTWPSVLGPLRGTAHLRLRLSEVRRHQGRRTALVRGGGDARLAGATPTAPAYRGNLVAEVLLDPDRHRVIRAAVDEEWVGSYRTPSGGDARVRVKGEWTLKRVEKTAPRE